MLCTENGHGKPEAVIFLLPDELIEEILLRLLVKCLLRFKGVCKPWKTLISDPLFVKKHLQRSTTSSDFTHLRLALASTSFVPYGHGFIPFSLKSLFNGISFVNLKHVPFKCMNNIVGSCNGLICFVDIQNRVHLWNPSTGIESKKSPPWEIASDKLRCFISFGFGCDQTMENYKVVSVIDYGKESHVSVYALGANSWKRIQSFTPGHHLFLSRKYNNSGKFVSGTLNWLATCDITNWELNTYELCVISLDLGKETCRKLLLPHFDKSRFNSSHTSLGVLRDYLCFIYEDIHEDKGAHLVVWQMKEYGVEESWTKLVTIPLLDFSYGSFYDHLVPLLILEDGEVLLQIASEIVLYNPRENRITWSLCESSKDYHGRNHNPWRYRAIYFESLVSP